MDKVLRPKQSKLDIKGRISYSEGNQAWNLIRLKKEILNEFPQLKEKRSVFGYQLLFYRTSEELEKAVKVIKKDGKALPILLYMYRE